MLLTRIWTHKAQNKKITKSQKQNTENKKDEQHCRDQRYLVANGKTIAIGDMIYHQLTPYLQLLDKEKTLILRMFVILSMYLATL
jgi:hypothetical protein